MRSIGSIITAALALAIASSAKECKPYVTSEKLQELITLEDLLSAAQKLQDIADAHGGNRAFGGGGHNATVDWLYDTLTALDYFDVVKQPFTELFHTASGTLSIGGAKVGSVSTMTYTPGGTVSAPLVLVSNLGCSVDDFSSGVQGKIAFISRGTCSFSQKSLNAKSAGAAAAVVYNNEPGPIAGTLGTPVSITFRLLASARKIQWQFWPLSRPGKSLQILTLPHCQSSVLITTSSPRPRAETMTMFLFSEGTLIPCMRALVSTTMALDQLVS
ncbi:hypothetical protein V2G26_011068 [Clonostachys chloroleuca]